MIKFTKITDGSFDSSAVLNVMSNASCFSKKENNQAAEIRRIIRNEWAHFNESTWSDSYYLKCFHLMENMVEMMPRPEDVKNLFDKDQIKQKLYKWRIDGLKLMERNVDPDIVLRVYH